MLYIRHLIQLLQPLINTSSGRAGDETVAGIADVHRE